MDTRFAWSSLVLTLLFLGLVGRAGAIEPDGQTYRPEPQVAVEVRIITLTNSLQQRLAKEFPWTGLDFPPGEVTPNPGSAATTAGGGRVSFPNDSEVRRFFELAQADRAAQILQSPEITTLNGQDGYVSSADKVTFITRLVPVRQPDDSVILTPVAETFEVGLKLSVQPLVSADGRFVQLGLKLAMTELETSPPPNHEVTMSTRPAGDDSARSVLTQYCVQQPLFYCASVDRTLVIPDGANAVFGGWKRLRNCREEFGPPILSKISYLSRAAKNAAYSREPTNVLLMVTPRVLTCAAAEGRLSEFSAPAAPVSGTARLLPPDTPQVKARGAGDR